MPTKIYDTIFLDQDGVICNFYLEAVRAHLRMGRRMPWLDHHGTPLQLHPQRLMERWPRGITSLVDAVGITAKGEEAVQEFWRPMLIEPSTWNWMEAFEYTHQLVELLQGYCNELVICTHAASGISDEYAGKRQWQANHKLTHLDLIIVEHKYRLAHPKALLIDDFHKNVERFQHPPTGRPGGEAILFPQPWNKNHEHWRHNVQFVREYLESRVPHQHPNNPNVTYYV